MPQPHGEPAHDRNQGNLLLFGILLDQLLVELPGNQVMTHVDPTGLAQNFSQSWRSLPADVAFTIALLTTFMARRCQPHKLADMPAPSKSSRVSDFCLLYTSDAADE